MRIRGFDVDSMIQFGFDVDSMIQFGFNVDSIWIQCGFSDLMGFDGIWFGFYADSVRIP